MKNFFFLLLLVFTLCFTTACGGDDDDIVTPDACALEFYSQEINDELQAFLDAATNYANDASTANCNAYRQAGQDYLDALRAFENCSNIVGLDEYREGVAEAQAELDALSC